MISAALLVRQRLAKKTRKLRGSFKNSRNRTPKHSGSGCFRRAGSVQSECVDKKSIGINFHINEKDQKESNLFAMSPAILYKNDQDRFSHEITVNLKTSSLYNVIFVHLRFRANSRA